MPRRCFCSRVRSRVSVTRTGPPAGGPTGGERSIAIVYRLLAIALAGAALLVAALPRPATSAASAGPTVSASLASLERSGAIAPPLHRQYLAEYVAAKHLLTKLSGTRAVELGAVMANVQAMAAAGEFIPSRLPALFETLQRNVQWWSTMPLLSADARVSFPGSGLVWEYYPGQGIEIQWLATFGEANGYWLSGQNAKLEALLNEVIPLATARAGGIAWEYLFQFDGGLPPWTSGLSQGTAIQALARAWSTLHVAAYRSAAAAALGIFQTPPPAGVRIATPAGAHYLEYTYAPGERIINGFIQSLNGLYDYTQLTGDPLGEQLFQAGNAEALIELPRYNTGAWSLYDQSTESDLSYHELLITFLQDLCARTSQSPNPLPPAGGTTGPTGPTGPAGAAPGAAGGTTGPGTSGAAVGASGGSAASTRGAGPRPERGVLVSNPDAIYCTTATSFQADLHRPPVLTFTPALSHAQAGRAVTVGFTLSKISTVTLTVARGGTSVYGTSILLGYGSHSLTWPGSAQAGAYTVTLGAVDLAGNHGSTSAPLTLTAPPSRRRLTARAPTTSPHRSPGRAGRP